MAHRIARRYFVHECTKLSIEPELGPKGDPVYDISKQTPFKARVEKQTKTVRTADGKEVVSSHVLATDVLIVRTDYIWFPSIDGEVADDVTKLTKARSPIVIDSATDRRGRKGLREVRF